MVLIYIVLLFMLVYGGAKFVNLRFVRYKLNKNGAGGGIARATPSDYGFLGGLIIFLLGIIGLILWPKYGFFVVLGAGALGLGLGYFVLSPAMPARKINEGFMMILLQLASFCVILIAMGIVFTLAFESFAFFKQVSIIEFLTDTKWSPQLQGGNFGILPLIWGTIAIAFIAIGLAVPVGILVAVYLAEYAHPKLAAVIKPSLELLAGIPSIVYGFFAAITIAPIVQDVGHFLGFETSSESALAAGLVIGIMIIPLVSSLSQEAISAVPQNMREASYGLGATQAETILMVVLPAAGVGIMNAVLLALARAVGETMIVVMAAGLAAKLTINPFESLTTITVQIVSLLTGDTEFDNPKTLAAYALGMALFLMTMGINFINQRVMAKK